MNTSQEFSGSPSDAVLALQQWLSAQLQAQYELKNTPAPWPDIATLSVSTTVYRREVYAFKDAAQASSPVYFEIGYWRGSTSTSASYTAPGWTLGVGRSLTQTGELVVTAPRMVTSANNSSTTSPPFRVSLVGHSGGFLLTSGPSTGSVAAHSLRVGRIRKGGRILGWAAAMFGWSVNLAQLQLTDGDRTSNAALTLSSPLLTGAVRLASGDALLTFPDLYGPNGILEREYVPLEFLLSPAADWSSGSSRRVLLSGQLVRMDSPVALAAPTSDVRFGGLNTTQVGLCPSEDL